MRRITDKIFHWSVSPPTTTVADIRRWHKQAGFRDIGYHRVILHPASREFKVKPTEWWHLVKQGRPDAQAGAGVYPPRWVNPIAFHTCVVGDPSYPLDPLQAKAVLEVATVITGRYKSIEWVGGHRDYQANQCPGDEVYKLITNWAKANGFKQR